MHKRLLQGENWKLLLIIFLLVIVISFHLKCTGAWLLLLGCRVLVVCGHSEWIGKDETEKKYRQRYAFIVSDRYLCMCKWFVKKYFFKFFVSNIIT